MFWSASEPITSRSIVRGRSRAARVLIWTAQHWLIGRSARLRAACGLRGPEGGPDTVIQTLHGRDLRTCARSWARKIETGYLLGLARDDRPSSGTAPPGVTFINASGRVSPGIQLACCRAHARRKLVESTRTGQGVRLIRQVYAMEAEI